MSEKEEQKEEVEAKPAKKSKKLPMILALALVLGGGSFFAMKMKAPKKKEEVSLGKIVQLEEYLTNLSNQTTYVRAKIALHMAKGFVEKGMEEKMPAISDAIVTDLHVMSTSDAGTIEGQEALKARIAKDVNAILSESEGSDAAKGVDKPLDEPATTKKDTKTIPTPHFPHGWASDKGPVLKVYFVTFATQ